MGWFLNVNTATINEQDGKFFQDTQSFQFWDDVYISWCQPLANELPDGWISFADGTLHAQYRTEYIPPPVHSSISPIKPDENAGIYRYSDAVYLGREGGLYHLVLPMMYLPIWDTVQPFPTYALPHKNRFVLGWIIEKPTRFNLNLIKADSKLFEQQARALQEIVDRGQDAFIERQREQESLNKQLFILRGNRQLFQEQAVNYGLAVPVILHNELQHVYEQIAHIEDKKRSLMPQW